MIILANQRGKIYEGIEWFKDKQSLVSIVVFAGLGTYVADEKDVEHWKRILLSRLGERDRNSILYDFPLYTRAVQGFGRAIRSENDIAVFVALDYRTRDYLGKTMKLTKIHDEERLSEVISEFFGDYPHLWQLRRQSFVGRGIEEILQKNKIKSLK